MKQKTAMQEFIDMFELDAKEYELDNVTIYAIINLYKKHAIKLLQKEKEQINEAYLDGHFDCYQGIYKSKNYYNETYKQD